MAATTASSSVGFDPTKLLVCTACGNANIASVVFGNRACFWCASPTRVEDIVAAREALAWLCTMYRERCKAMCLALPTAMAPEAQQILLDSFDLAQHLCVHCLADQWHHRAQAGYVRCQHCNGHGVNNPRPTAQELCYTSWRGSLCYACPTCSLYYVRHNQILERPLVCEHCDTTLHALAITSPEVARAWHTAASPHLRAKASAAAATATIAPAQ